MDGTRLHWLITANGYALVPEDQSLRPPVEGHYSAAPLALLNSRPGPALL
jgi:hypothetical protein